MASDKVGTNVMPLHRFKALSKTHIAFLIAGSLWPETFRHRSIRSRTPFRLGFSKIGLPPSQRLKRRMISYSVLPRIPRRKSVSQLSFLSTPLENHRAVASAMG